ncbi:hypothetical protein ACHWQZ_G012669 [Mnemiopsis leidyi]
MYTTQATHSLLPLLLLILLTPPALSLMCSQCQEITINGQYYDEGPRDCLDPTPVECSPGEDRCVSAGVTFQLLNEEDTSSTVDFGIKYCGNRDVTCQQIEQEMLDSMDYGTMAGFQCHIGTKCEADLCNQLVPVVRPETWSTSTGQGSTTRTPTPQDVVYQEGVEYAVNEVETVNDEIDNIVLINEAEADLEGNDQAITSGQSKYFSQSGLLILCGLLLLRL